MRKQLVSLLLVALLGMTVLGGCADSTKPSANNSSETKATTETVAATTTTETVESTGFESTGEAVYGGSVVVGIQQDIDGLDPHKVTSAGTKEILFNIFEGLVKPDENGNLIDAVASAHSVSEDGLEYTFTLRDGVKFHNGNDVTVEDVKYSLERVSGLLDGTPLISSLKGLTSVDIVDEKTVRVTVGSANTELIYSFVCAIIPAGSGEDENAEPIGTGPFKFVSYKPGEGVKMAKNDAYWQSGLPYLDEVNFKVITSSDTALLELQGGAIDVYPYLTDSQAEVLKGQNTFNIAYAASDVVQAVFLNNDYEPLQNVKVRQAISYALDKDSINEFVAGGNGTLIGSAMLPTLEDYYEDHNDVYGTGADLEKAKALLAEAGYPNGFNLAIMVPSNYEFHMETAEVVVEQLKAAGINATIDSVEWSTWLEKCYTNREYQATVCGITCDMTPGYLLNRFQSDHKKNFINFKSEKYDEIYVKAAAALNLEEKAQYYKELQQILVDEAGTAFIMAPPITVAMKTGLEGYKFYPVYVQDMSTVYYVK